ncbi:MAG TPA: pseudomurein-binding repeat-containing protein [Methanobacterium sp.]|nr:pseudomurein-binding repeat-containing protein [Methanobacterium sp.]
MDSWDYGGGIINRKVLTTLLLILSLTLSLNAVTAATTNQTHTDDKTQGNQINTSTTTTNTSSTRYEGTPDTGTSSTVSAAGSALAAGSSDVIKVLIYSGTGASTNCVNGVKTALASANSNNLVSGVTFSYATSSTLTSTILSGYDLLVMPGGSGGSVYLNTISKSVIQNFVKNGGGYLGICAGAYAAAAHTDGYYDGWGIAPHVYAKAVSYEGKLNMTITSTGAQVLNRSGTITISHYNGAAMYLTSSSAKIFATYADSKTGYKGYADIVGDFYGNGRTVLIGSHPELSPQYPDIIANLIVWATSTSTSNNSNTGTKVTISQVVSAASTVKNYYDKNSRLPNYVTINSTQISMAKFLYLLTTATKSLGSGSSTSTSINVKSVNAPSSASGTYKSGSIAKSAYLTYAQNIINFINSNGRAPNYVTTSLGKISYTKMIYMYTKILTYYKTYSKLPSSVQMTA